MHHDAPPPPHHPRHPAHHHGPHERHPFDSFIRALRLLDSADVSGHRRAGSPGGLQTVADIIALAERAFEPKIAELLRGFDAGLDPTLAIDKIDVILAEEASVRRRQIHAIAAERQVALVGHLPPHIHEAFADYDGVTVLFPEEDHLPHHLRAFGADRIIRSVSTCRRVVSSADVILCDVFRNSRWYAPSAVVDLIDSRVIRAHARLLVHPRPHQESEDIAFDESIASRIELY